MRARHLTWKAFVAAILTLIAFQGRISQSADPEPEGFRVSEPIVCKSVEGLRNYVRRDPPELTTFDKLVVYVEPSGFETRMVEGKRKAHFVQNGKVRPAGSKKFFFERSELTKFEPEVFGPGATFYLAASVGFKNVPPGEYVLELETVDLAAEPDRKVTQIVPFRIVKGQEEAAGEDRPKSERQPAKPGRKSRN
jgi:hypothetical protein